MGIFKEGFYHITHGNWDRIADWIIRQSGEYSPWEHISKIDEYELGQKDEPAIICKIDNDDGVYTSIFGDSTVTYSPEEPFENIIIPIIHLDKSETIELTVNFDLVDGQSENQTRKFNHHTFPSEEISFFSISPTRPAVKAEIALEADSPTQESYFAEYYRENIKRGSQLSPRSRLGLPHAQSRDEQPPIFLISIDTLRYDMQDQLKPLIDILGDDVVIPSEPRTQGCWTAPSHGSIFTGEHPGTHGYGGGEGLRNARDTSLRPDLLTLPEILSEAGYKASGVASHSIISPEYGFGRGFSRYQMNRMVHSNWLSRKNDVSDTIDIASEWLSRDLSEGTEQIFYFLHLFDPHHPYIPPTEQMPSNTETLETVTDYMNIVKQYNRDYPDYVSKVKSEDWYGEEYVGEITSLYEKSVRYTASALRRFIAQIKAEDLFDDALIIITGDHGEEFGERGFYTHISLYDNNIRPFLAVKPPSSATWEVPDQVDTIDIFPTLAKIATGHVPSQSSGQPMQTSNSANTPRITERVTKYCYNIAVEQNHVKAIYTFETDWPDRPTKDQIENGLKLVEYYNLENIRNGDFNQISPSDEMKEELKEIAETFISKQEINQPIEEREIPETTDETKENLEALGYF